MVTPHLTTFIGRERELAEIAAMLADPACRLLTLVGPGGIGKTRLAVAGMARHAPTDTTIGIHFVPLQPVSDAALLPITIANAIGIQFFGADEPRVQLLHYLQNRHMLLILDNFEHLLDGVDFVVEMLAAPGVRLLVTSRVALNVQAEWRYAVGGLEIPPSPQTPPHPRHGEGLRIYNFDAVRLFTERARHLRHDFDPVHHRADVIRICQLTEGMPLALELAAGWLRALSCAQIANEIQRGLDFLAADARDVPERHRSMAAAFAQSWHMLTDNEQKIFRRMSVFRGGFTREAAENVAGATLHTLASLVDKSLLRVSAAGRYDIHELLRQYGAAKLDAAGEIESIRDAHSAYYLDFVAQREADVKGRRQVAALAEIKADFENIRTTWDSAVARRYTDSINQMIEGLWLFCTLCNRKAEGAALFQEAAQQFKGERRLWGRLLARIAHGTVDSQSQLETALHIAREFDDLGETAFCLEWLGYSMGLARDYVKTKQLLEQSLAAYRRLGDRYYIADVLFKLLIFDADGSWENHKNLGEESLRLRREIGDRIGTAWSINPLAHSYLRIGQFAEAERTWMERVTIGYEVGDLELVAMGHAFTSYQVYFIQGDFAKARAAAEEAIEITSRISAFHHITAEAWALLTLGLLAIMDENYHEGNALFQQAVSRTVLRNVSDFAAWGLSMAACGLGDFETARQLLPTALKHCAKMFGVVGIMICLPLAALILAHQDQKARAVEYLALAFTHPVRASGWMEKWPLLGRFRAELEQALGSKAYVAAWERGEQLDAEIVLSELWTRFAPKDDANPSLEDPLTPRELEILRLLAAGLSNAQIAERLVISVGTAKTHVHNIYSKLGVENRAHAIAHIYEQNNPTKP